MTDIPTPRSFSGFIDPGEDEEVEQEGPSGSD